MGASWYDVLQALLLGIVIQMLGSVVCVICACVWRSVKERVSRPTAGGEPMAEPDLELGTVTGDEGIDRPSGSAANRSAADCEDAHHQRKLGRTADMADLQNRTMVPAENASEKASEQDAHFAAIKDNLSKVGDHVTKDETKATVPAIIDVSHTQQLEVVTGK